MTALQCSDPFNDCVHHQPEHSQCRTELAEYCDQCEPTPETPENEAACYRYTGECDSDLETTRCEFYVRAGRCSSMELWRIGETKAVLDAPQFDITSGTA